MKSKMKASKQKIGRKIQYYRFFKERNIQRIFHLVGLITNPLRISINQSLSKFVYRRTIVDSLGGVLLEQDYFPYANEQRECRWRQIGDPVPIPVTGFKRVYPNEDVMLEYVYQYGPLSAGKSINNTMCKYKDGGNIRQKVT